MVRIRGVFHGVPKDAFFANRMEKPVPLHQYVETSIGGGDKKTYI